MLTQQQAADLLDVCINAEAALSDDQVAPDIQEAVKALVAIRDGPPGWDYDLTPSDIIAWLRAHPAQAVEVLEAVTVVGDWRDDYGEQQRSFVPPNARFYAALACDAGTGEWYWTAFQSVPTGPGDSPEQGTAPTREEAMAAADAALDKEWIVCGRRGSNA